MRRCRLGFCIGRKKAGADALVTGDGKYHEFLDATDEEILLVSAGHYETEFPAVVSLCKLLEDKFKDIQFKVAEQKLRLRIFEDISLWLLTVLHYILLKTN